MNDQAFEMMISRFDAIDAQLVSIDGKIDGAVERIESLECTRATGKGAALGVGFVVSILTTALGWATGLFKVVP